MKKIWLLRTGLLVLLIASVAATGYAITHTEPTACIDNYIASLDVANTYCVTSPDLVYTKPLVIVGSGLGAALLATVIVKQRKALVITVASLVIAGAVGGGIYYHVDYQRAHAEPVPVYRDTGECVTTQRGGLACP